MSTSQIQAKARSVHEKLKKAFPDARIELNFSSPLELLVATLLAAQSTDVRVNKVTEDLFKKYPAPKDYLGVPEEELQEDIRSTGFFRQKAKSLRNLMRTLIDEHGGQVPADLDALVRLPGVGRKTANVVLGNALGVPGIAVDTHVNRVSNRLGLTKESKPDKIEMDLNDLLPRRDWVEFNLGIILQGRYVCKARGPLCDECSLVQDCDYYRENVVTGRS